MTPTQLFRGEIPVSVFDYVNGLIELFGAQGVVSVEDFGDHDRAATFTGSIPATILRKFLNAHSRRRPGRFTARGEPDFRRNPKFDDDDFFWICDTPQGCLIFRLDLGQIAWLLGEARP